MRKIVVAITGASGSIYARNLFQKLSLLKDHWNELGLIMSANAQQVWQTELGDESYKNLPGNVLQNRSLLRSLMEKHGFKALETEWWHYYLPDTSKYELLDLSFDELYKTL